LQKSGVPAPVLNEGIRRTHGKRRALNANIKAAEILSEAMKTSLGPKGLDKMLVSGAGVVYITSDGARILEKMDISNPIARMLVEVAKTQDEITGDGTTTVVVLAGELLKEARDLIDKRIHPSIVVKGYEIAAKEALRILKELAIKVNPQDKDVVKKIAKVALSSKLLAEHIDLMTDMATEAMLRILDKKTSKYDEILDDIKIQKKHGNSLTDSMLVDGLVIDKVDKEVVLHTKMPRRVHNAKIALIVNAIEIKKPEFSTKISIEKPNHIKTILKEEENLLKNKLDRLSELRVNVLICQRDISEKAVKMLADRNILAVKRVKFVEMDRLVKATGGNLVTDIEELESKDLGYAGIVEERKFGKDKQALSKRDMLLFIEKCKNPKALTILIRGGTETLVREAEIAINDALCVIREIMKEPYIIVGGGAVELEISRRLRSFAEEFKGKEQVSILSFSKALESITAALAENSGLNSIDVLTKLRAKHNEGEIWYGVDPIKGNIMDLYKKGIYEPISVKNQAIISASEVSQMILKIDDIIFLSQSGGKEKGQDKEEDSGEG